MAQLDVAALQTILWSFGPQGTILPMAIKAMKKKIRLNLLSAAELAKLSALRLDFPQYDAQLGGAIAPIGPAQILHALPNGHSQTAPRPAQAPAQASTGPKKLDDRDFPPLGGGRR